MSKKCTHCNTNTTPVHEIPLVAAECEATRQQRVIMRLIWSVMLLTALLFGSNLAWVIYGVLT